MFAQIPRRRLDSVRGRRQFQRMRTRLKKIQAQEEVDWTSLTAAMTKFNLFRNHGAFQSCAIEESGSADAMLG
jgi:hypothetical protein